MKNKSSRRTILGVCKLLFGWLTFGIWPLIDWFLIMGATRQTNLEKINQALAAIGVMGYNW